MSASGASSHAGEAPTKAAPGDLHSIVTACNRDGMDFLRKGNQKAAFEQLKYA
jgi:hypothetical protein